MKFNYFEEYPQKLTGEQLSLAEGMTVYVAAKSYEEFLRVETDLKVRNRKVNFAYWPILGSSYWVSPFSSMKDIEKLATEVRVDKGQHKILIDLEFPLLRPHRFILGLSGYRKKTQMILKLLADNGNLFTAENPVPLLNWHNLKKKIGMSYDNPNRIFLCYQGFFLSRILHKSYIRHLKRLCSIGPRPSIGLGTNSSGVFAINKVVGRDLIQKDAATYKDGLGVDNFYIYQLSGEKCNNKS